MGFVKTDIKTIEKNVFRMIGDEWAENRYKDH